MWFNSTSALYGAIVDCSIKEKLQFGMPAGMTGTKIEKQKKRLLTTVSKLNAL